MITITGNRGIWYEIVNCSSAVVLHRNTSLLLLPNNCVCLHPILKSEADTSEEADLLDYQRLQLRRLNAEQWVREPFFDDAVKGMFVRIQIGVNERNEAIYRMAEVIVHAVIITMI